MSARKARQARPPALPPDAAALVLFALVGHAVDRGVLVGAMLDRELAQARGASRDRKAGKVLTKGGRA